MLSISNPLTTAHCQEYYQEQETEGYYLNGVDQPGRWFGKGVQQLGLPPEVVPQQFHNLLRGFPPDGWQALVQNAGDIKRQSAWDLTFSAPKSVSVLWALSSNEARRQIEAAHQRAVEKALAYAEDVGGITRRGKGGRIEEKTALTFAIFPHGTSRANDPNLHSHCLLLNLSVRQDGTTGTLRTDYIFEKKLVIGAVYQSELAVDLRKHLGLTLEPDPVGFHIQGVPRELCREFSKRRRAILKAMQDRGVQGGVAAKIAALDTRPLKQQLPPAELFAQWQKVGESYGWAAAQAAQVLQPASQKQVTGEHFNETLRREIACLSSQEQTRRCLVRLASKLATAHGVDSETLVRSLEEHRLPDGRPLVRRRPPQEKKQRLVGIEWRRWFDRTPWIPPRRKLIHVEYKQVFPLGWWAWARKRTWPVITIETPRIVIRPFSEFKPHWGHISWKKDLFFGELRVQKYTVFPSAPKWSWAHGFSHRALHFTFRRSKWQPLKPSHNNEHGHSH